jgi:hypothetical protein
VAGELDTKRVLIECSAKVDFAVALFIDASIFA